MIFVYVVCANLKEAKKIAKQVVKKRLAACANFFPMQSVYWWKGKFVRDREVALIFKTRKELFRRVKTAVRQLHSYEVPCITSLTASGTHKAYLDWVYQETKPRK